MQKSKYILKGLLKLWRNLFAFFQIYLYCLYTMIGINCSLLQHGYSRDFCLDKKILRPLDKSMRML